MMLFSVFMFKIAKFSSEPKTLRRNWMLMHRGLSYNQLSLKNNFFTLHKVLILVIYFFWGAYPAIPQN